MTQEEKEILLSIQGSHAFKLMEFMVQQKIEELDTVSTLDARSIDRAGIEALARKNAVKVLKDFLGELGFSFIKRETNKTYE